MVAKPSQFNILTEYEPTGETLVFNTSTGAVVAYPRDLSQDVQDILRGDASGVSELRTQLADQGFLVEAGVDEVAGVLRRLQMGISDPNRLDVFILPNMKCNFGCPYCYEQHFASRMTDDVRDRIMAWL